MFRAHPVLTSAVVLATKQKVGRNLCADEDPK